MVYKHQGFVLASFGFFVKKILNNREDNQNENKSKINYYYHDAGQPIRLQIF